MIFSPKTAELNYLNIDEFIDNLVPNELQIEVEYQSDFVIDRPLISITLNQIEIYSDKAKEHGQISLNVPVKFQKNYLSVSMTGKPNNGTIVENGKIIKDTFIKLLKLKINKYSLLDDFDFLHENFIYKHADGENDSVKDGFWTNSSLSFEFETPFELWYNSKSKKNVEKPKLLHSVGIDGIDNLILQLEESIKKLK